VSASDKGTQKQQNIVIQSSGGLSKEEIEKMSKDAELNFEKDKEFKEKVSTVNEIESFTNNTESQLKEHKEKLPADEVKEAEGLLVELKELSQNPDSTSETMREKLDSTRKRILDIFTALYKNNAAAGETNTNTASDADESSKQQNNN